MTNESLGKWKYKENGKRVRVNYLNLTSRHKTLAYNENNCKEVLHFSFPHRIEIIYDDEKLVTFGRDTAPYENDLANIKSILNSLKLERVDPLKIKETLSDKLAGKWEILDDKI